MDTSLRPRSPTSTQDDSLGVKNTQSNTPSPKPKYTDAQIAMDRQIQEATQFADMSDFDPNRMTPARRRAGSSAQQLILEKIEAAQKQEEEATRLEYERVYQQELAAFKEKEIARIRREEEAARKAKADEEARQARLLAAARETPKKVIDAQRAVDRMIQEATEFAALPEYDATAMTPSRRRAGSQVQQSLLNKAEAQKKKEEEEALAAKLEAEARKNARSKIGAEKMQNHIGKLSAREQAELEREKAEFEKVYQQELARAKEAEIARLQQEQEARAKQEEAEERRRQRAAQVTPTKPRLNDAARAVQRQIDEATEFAEFPDYDPNKMTPARKRAGSAVQQSLMDQATQQRRQTMEQEAHAKAQEAGRRALLAKAGQEKMAKHLENMTTEVERVKAEEKAEYDRVYVAEMARLTLQAQKEEAAGGRARSNSQRSPASLSRPPVPVSPVVDRTAQASAKKDQERSELQKLEQERKARIEKQKQIEKEELRKREDERRKRMGLPPLPIETKTKEDEEEKNALQREQEERILKAEQERRIQEDILMKSEQTRKDDEVARLKRLEEEKRREEEERLREEREDEELRMKEEQLRKREEELLALEKFYHESTSLPLVEREKTMDQQKQALQKEENELREREEATEKQRKLEAERREKQRKDEEEVEKAAQHKREEEVKRQEEEARRSLEEAKKREEAERNRLEEIEQEIRRRKQQEEELEERARLLEQERLQLEAQEEEELRLMRERDAELLQRERALALLEAQYAAQAAEAEKRQREEDEDFLRREAELKKRAEEIARLEQEYVQFLSTPPTVSRTTATPSTS